MRTFTFILASFTVFASLAILPPPNNAISLSLGGASSTYLNAFGVENNIASLAFSENEISLNGGNRFGLSDYSTASIAGNLSVDFANIGFAYSISPFSTFTEQKAQLGIAKKLGKKVSAGVALNYHTFSSTNAYYQNTSLLTFNAGLYYQLNDKLNAGFSFFNPNRSLLTETPNERLAAIFRLGIDYSIAEDLTLYSDYVQASEQRPDFNAGLELTKEKYFFRGGFGINQLVAIGFGWQATDQFQLDVAAAYHNQLGFSPSLNISYAF